MLMNETDRRPASNLHYQESLDSSNFSIEISVECRLKCEILFDTFQKRKISKFISNSFHESFCNSIEEYDPQTNKWREVGKLT